MIAGISICSLLDNNSDVDEINIFLVADDITENNREKLREIADRYNRTLFFLPKPNVKELLGCDLDVHWANFPSLHIRLHQFLPVYPAPTNL